jgi:hypothetical protein
MSPVKLGDLPSNQPVPTGKIQFKLAGPAAAVVCPPNNTIMGDNSGNPMQIAITTPPTRGGWWVIRAENIFSLADGAWYYFAWYVQLSPADADGKSIDYAHHRLHNALGWQQSCLDTAFKLNANTAYTCAMYFRDRQAGTVYYFTGPEYCYISGEFIAEGSI